MQHLQIENRRAPQQWPDASNRLAPAG